MPTEDLQDLQFMKYRVTPCGRRWPRGASRPLDSRCSGPARGNFAAGNFCGSTAKAIGFTAHDGHDLQKEELHHESKYAEAEIDQDEKKEKNRKGDDFSAWPTQKSANFGPAAPRVALQGQK